MPQISACFLQRACKGEALWTLAAGRAREHTPPSSLPRAFADTEEVLTVEDVSDAAAGMNELEHVEAAHDGDRVDAEADEGDVPQGGGAEAQEGKSDQVRVLARALPFPS